MHIAAALATPIISFCGPSLISKNYPIAANKSKIVLIIADVWCAPCQLLDYEKRCVANVCMNKIDNINIEKALKLLNTNMHGAYCIKGSDVFSLAEYLNSFYF